MIKYYLRAFWPDLMNRIRFGVDAPRHSERIWVLASECTRYIEARELTELLGDRVRRMSGRVLQEWPTHLEQPFENHPKLLYCDSHWRDGESWSDSGAIEFMMSRIAVSPTGMVDECRTLNDVERRFETLDAIWTRVQEKGQLPTRAEVEPSNFREMDGILIHLGPGGEPIFSGAGCHRFAMARMLDAPFPAQLGCVHSSALSRLPQFRRAV